MFAEWELAFLYVGSADWTIAEADSVGLLPAFFAAAEVNPAAVFVLATFAAAVAEASQPVGDEEKQLAGIGA